MKKITLLLASLILAGCATTHYHNDGEVYYDEGYYSNDYDPYYGYAGYGDGYSTDGSGIYYNNYNYYPDRWGITYSSSYYSPYRYPRIGFYYQDCYFWTYGCHSSWRVGFNSWAYWGVGSSWYYNDYWWYNNWRHRNYHHHNPRYGRYSAREEAQRLANRTRSHHLNRKYNKPRTDHRAQVSRERSRYSTTRQTSRKPRALSQPAQGTVRRSANEVQRIRQSSRYNKPAAVNPNEPVVRNLPTRSRQPVYERRGVTRAVGAEKPQSAAVRHQRTAVRQEQNRAVNRTQSRQVQKPRTHQNSNRQATKPARVQKPPSSQRSSQRSSHRSSNSSSKTRKTASRSASRDRNK